MSSSANTSNSSSVAGAPDNPMLLRNESGDCSEKATYSMENSNDKNLTPDDHIIFIK
jgi:hypothetical protein